MGNFSERRQDWLSDRLYAHGTQTGTYAEVTHAQALAYLVDADVFDRLGIAPRDVDASLLKTRINVT